MQRRTRIPPSTQTQAFCQGFDTITLPDGSAPLPLVGVAANITSASATAATVASQWSFDVSGAKQLNPAIASYMVVDADPYGYQQVLDVYLFNASQLESTFNQGMTPISEPLVLTMNAEYALTETDTARVGPLCGGMTTQVRNGEFFETRTLDTYSTSSMSHHYLMTFYDASGNVVQVAGLDGDGNPIMMDSQPFGLMASVSCPDSMSSNIVCADAS